VRRRVAVRHAAVALLASVVLARPVAAHAGSLSGSYRSAPIPSWLLTVTGAAIIGVSFLLTSLVTDHATIRGFTDWRARLPTADALRRAAVLGARIVGVAVLLGTLAVGFLSPASASANAAVLFVWAGWWAGYTMTTYLVANTWPLFDPWRTIARSVPAPRRALPAGLGRWPAVVGLLGLVYVEVVLPVAQAPRVLAALVFGYSVVTILGAAAVGVDDWFASVDPIANVFEYYGRMAPIQRTTDGIQLRPPGGALTDPTGPETRSGTAFVVALLWATTFDGLVTTPAWRDLVDPVLAAGVPGLLVYLLAMVVGFGVFLGAYRLVARWARRTADSYVTAEYIAGWFAPALLPIAAGYHVAHFLGYFLSLSPALLAVLDQPFTAVASVPVAVLPGWFGALQLTFVVVGHLLAIWVAHALSFELFTGRLQPLRSQYPFVIVMIAYTAVSMWIVSQPFTAPPGL
jgi:hypothetical protein